MNRLDILLILTIVAGFCCLGTVGSVVTRSEYHKGYWLVAGNSAHMFLFITSCIACTVGVLMVSTRDDATKTRFFTSFNGIMAIFYMASGIAAIVHSTDGDTFSFKDLKQSDIAGAVIGMIAAILHGITSILTRF